MQCEASICGPDTEVPLTVFTYRWRKLTPNFISLSLSYSDCLSQPQHYQAEKHYPSTFPPPPPNTCDATGHPPLQVSFNITFFLSFFKCSSLLVSFHFFHYFFLSLFLLFIPLLVISGLLVNWIGFIVQYASSMRECNYGLENRGLVSG
jgi:hypothetical protein